MPVLLELKNVCKSHGPHVLLDGTDLTLYDDQKVALIGRNGCGKSTLCRILTGEEELDHGEVVRHRILRLGYLRQHDSFLPGETAIDFLIRDSGQPDWRCAEVAARFDIRGVRVEGPAAALSGGWRTRIRLAALLLHEPNLLLLDEPTNFLDLRTQLLLERFLRDWQGGCLVVSHDRTFLQATCDRTLDLSRGKLRCFAGPIEGYLEERERRRIHDQRVNEANETKRRQLQIFIDRNRAGAATASQAKSKQKQLDRLEFFEIERAEASARIRLPAVDPRQGTALTCKDLAVGYPERTIASDIRLEVDHGARLLITGDNGQGKTTFLRTIAGSLPEVGGSFRWGHGCRVGVYAQHVYASLSEKLTIRETLQAAAVPGTTTRAVEDAAGGFLFGGGTIDREVRVLSGGERARVCLASLFLGKHNILILDEPANHLDVETVEALADALADFAGTVLFVSHDRRFARRVARQVAEVRDGRIALFSGDYETYLAEVGRELGEASNAKQPEKPDAKPAAPANDREKARERHTLQREIVALERKIAKSAELRAAAEAKMRETTDWQALASLQADVDRFAARQEEAEAAWIEAQGRLDGMA